MPVTVIVGGQYGSEGKGKVAHWLARERSASVAVRTGGPNAGHTVIDVTARPLVLRQLPTSAILPNVVCALGPGSYIDPDILLSEVAKIKLAPDRLLIDPNAIVVSEEDKKLERDSTLRASIGSTETGTGAAIVRRIDRKGTGNLAKNDARLARYLTATAEFLRAQLSAGKRIVLEGTQGFGLSILHSPTYPYVTSRDTTAAAFVSEAGLSPLDVDEVVLVLRAFPIRVAGNSGFLRDITDWETVTQESGSPTAIVEYTSVTQQVRRVGRFDPDIVRAAICVNAPTHIALNHLDYVDYKCRETDSLSFSAQRFVEKIESSINSNISFLGFGPSSLVRRQACSRRSKFSHER